MRVLHQRGETDFFPLSSMQEGMLFHHLHSRHSGVDVEQLVCSLHEALDAEALKAAWARVVDRHDVLRTSFQWENADEPVQTVHPLVGLPFAVNDLEGASDLQHQDALSRYLESDRASGFDLD